MHDSSIQNVFNRTSCDLICDPIGIVVILIIIKVRYVRYAWILGVFVLSCCLILLHTYLRYGRTDLIFVVVVDRLDRKRKKKKKRKERWRRTLHLPGGLLLGYVSTPAPSPSILFPERESVWRLPPTPTPTQKKETKKKSELTKTHFFFLSHPRNQQISPASATINVEAVLAAKNISKNSKPNTGRANKSVWELLRKFKLLRD